MTKLSLSITHHVHFQKPFSKMMTTKQELLSLLPEEVARQSLSGRQCSAGEEEEDEEEDDPDPEACLSA